MNNHIDEIRKMTVSHLLDILQKFPTCRIALLHDLFGKIKFVVFPEKEKESDLTAMLRERLNEYAPIVDSDPQSIWVSNNKTSKLGKKIYDDVWEEGEPHNEEPRLRIAERYRTHGGWLSPLNDPPWEKKNASKTGKPPIIAFYSFKGGVGRTTALAAFAIQRSRTGERVVVIDADLDAPGVGTLLAADENGTTSQWGITDYLLEKELNLNLNLQDYYHACRRENVTGSGEILVFPAGIIDENYPWKLARLDLEPDTAKHMNHPFDKLVKEIQEKLKPDWILIDVRAGLAIPSGRLLGGFAHLNVIFGTSSEQSWKGLALLIERLGAQRIIHDKPQENLILVHAMVPRNPDLAEKMAKDFVDRALDEFSNRYYSKDQSDDCWTLEDVDSSDAPHIPVAVHYDELFVNLKQIDRVADSLAASNDFKCLTQRILEYFGDISNE